VRYRREISQKGSSNVSLGGAERLVVDAALGLQKLGHSVDIYTSHHDPNHCFEETRDGERL
jgi:alpha-1,3/alpha-1,6-mannosyltransferase